MLPKTSAFSSNFKTNIMIIKKPGQTYYMKSFKNHLGNKSITLT